MSASFVIKASLRQDKGKGASRRLRRDNKVPGVLYGAGQPAVALVVDHDPIMHSLENEAFYSHILTVDVDGKAEKAVLKDLQRHPYKPSILHLDLQRIIESEKLRMQVPLHFINEESAPGVKQGGGVISHLMNDLEISCLPKNLPEYIEVDMANVQLNETVHISDLKLPVGVESVELMHGAEHDQPVVSIHLLRGASSAEEAATEGEETGGGEGEEA